MTRNKLYALLSTACLIGYFWISLSFRKEIGEASLPGICLFRQMTSIPCPSCGSTRSVISLLHGNLKEAVFFNPLGFPISVFLLVFPFWMTYDLITQNHTFFTFYQKAELLIKRKQVAVILFVMIALNWIWNIYKLK